LAIGFITVIRIVPILRLRVPTLLYLPHVVPAIGKKRYLCIHCHALRFQQLSKALPYNNRFLDERGFIIS
jgi:hypothetical protein